jgi:ligand-binding sensor domain-containing protein
MKTQLSLFWFFLFSVMLVLPSELVGQQPKISFEKYGVAEGLPEARVSSMIQDDQGFIWFATQNGLVKYEGYDFKTYEPTPKAVDSTQLNLRNLKLAK